MPGPPGTRRMSGNHPARARYDVMRHAPAVIVVGASAGGVEAVRSLAAALPADFPAAVLVVLHIGAHRSELPWLLNQAGPLPAVHPEDGDAIRPARIYVAPPDRHMLVEPGRVRLTRGPRENWARPAIDPLFRSAARSYGTGAVGVVLTGGLNDGTAGLYEIKRAGGTAVVQDPADAAEPGMPRSALAHVAVDHCIPLAGLAGLLVRLAAAGAAGIRPDWARPAPSEGQGMTTEYKHDRPVAVTCPDCGGALRRTELGTLTRFGCHIGHAYTAEVLVAAQFAALEGQLEATLRSFGERGELCRQMAEKCRTGGDGPAASQWETATREADDRTGVLRRLLEEQWTHPAGIDGPHRPPG